MDKGLSGLKIWNNGLMELARLYAETYKRDGKLFITCFLKFKSVRSVCKAIIKSLGDDMESLRGVDFSGYCEKFETDRQTLNDTLRVIYFLTN